MIVRIGGVRAEGDGEGGWGHTQRPVGGGEREGGDGASEWMYENKGQLWSVSVWVGVSVGVREVVISDSGYAEKAKICGVEVAEHEANAAVVGVRGRLFETYLHPQGSAP